MSSAFRSSLIAALQVFFGLPLLPKHVLVDDSLSSGGEIVDAQYSFIIKKNSNKQTNEHS